MSRGPRTHPRPAGVRRSGPGLRGGPRLPGRPHRPGRPLSPPARPARPPRNASATSSDATGPGRRPSAARETVQVAPSGCRVAGVEPRGEQRARQPGEHVAAARRGQPARPGGVHPHRPAAPPSATRVVEPFSSTVAPVRAASSPTAASRRASTSAASSPAAGRLARVRGEQRGCRPAPTVPRRPAGAARRRRPAPARRPRARPPAPRRRPSPMPGPTTQAWTRPAFAGRPGVPGPRGSGRSPRPPRGPDVPHGPRAAAQRARRPRAPRRPGTARTRRPPDDARAGTCRSRAPGRGSSAATSACCSASGRRPRAGRRRGRCRRAAARPACSARRVDQQPGLVRAEGHRRVGAHGVARGPRRCRRPRRSAGRRRPPARGRRAASASRPRLRPQPAAAADADDPVQDQVGRRPADGRVGASRDPPPGGPQRGQPARVHPVRRGSTARTRRRGGPAGPRRTGRRRRCRRCRRAAPPGRRRPALRRSRSPQAAARPVAARSIRAPSGSRAISARSAARTVSTLYAVASSSLRPPRGDQPAAARPRTGGAERSPSAITMAERPRVVQEMCQPGTPSSAARAATVPRTRAGAARCRRRTSPRPASAARPARRAPWRALPWRRTARPARRSPRVRRSGSSNSRSEQPLGQPRRPLQRRGEAVDVRDIDADSDDHATRHSLLLDRDGLRQVARLVDVVALGGRQLAGEDLQRHGGDQRLHQRRQPGPG